jgi:hypothetical protein
MGMKQSRIGFRKYLPLMNNKQRDSVGEIMDNFENEVVRAVLSPAAWIGEGSAEWMLEVTSVHFCPHVYCIYENGAYR